MPKQNAKKIGRLKLTFTAGAMLLVCWLLVGLAPADAFDHTHAAWNALLIRHTVVSKDGHASSVQYTAMAKDREQLTAYLETLSGVGEAEFRSWNTPQQLAFLINAYNGFTVALVLTRYPDLASIKDLGSLFSSPWKQGFFKLFGAETNLDEIEHQWIRAKGGFHEPRIHVALNCAAIGCPMLRPEAYVADRLDQQLTDGMRRFLADRSRNYFDPKTKNLMVSKIFDWYRQDFEQGWRGLTSLPTTLAIYAALLASAPADQELIRRQEAPIQFLDYDWRLNDHH